MILSPSAVEELRWWAEKQAPIAIDTPPSMLCGIERRPIRLEIAAEECDWMVAVEHYVIARVFLREPRCYHDTARHSELYECECGPLAERRLS